MAENVGGIYYEVEADTSDLVNSSSRVDKSLDDMNKRFGQTDRAARSAEMKMTKTATAVRGLGREAGTASANLGRMSGLLAGLVSLRSAGALITMAEAYGEMAERIQMATSSQEEYELVQSRLLTTANGTYRALSEAQEVYILTADSLRSMGYETEQVLDITDSLSYAFVKNATTADRAANTTRAYTNAIMKGKVEADGWATIVSAVPSIIQDIANASGESTEAIRKMGAEGKLTTQMLNEGLRQSLDSNRKAADGMATTVKDAFTNLRTNLSVYVGEANRAHGSTEILAKAIGLLGENIETVVDLLMVAGAGVMAKYIASLGASAIASAKAALAARAQATAEVEKARALVASTGAAAASDAVTKSLTVGNTAAKAAVDAHTAALGRLRAAQAAVAGVGRTLLGVLGGPVGLIALAASAGAAFLTMGRNARDTKPRIDLLTTALNELGDAQLRVLRTGLIDKITEMDSLAGEAAKAGARIEYLNRQLAMHPNSKEAANWRRELDEQAAVIEKSTKELEKYREQQALVEAEQNRRAGGTSTPVTVTPSDPEVEKRLQAMRDEVALAKLTGEARAKLQAIQRLGANATKEEQEEAERLAAEIFQLEEARKKLTQSTKDDTKANDENANVIQRLAQELYLAGLAGEQLAVAKARMSLTPAATPEEIAVVEEMAAALWKVTEAERARAEFGKNPDEYILGKTDPLSGGEFDNQAARYEAEAVAEQERYAAQLERLQQARELQIETNKTYDQLELEAAQQHADRMAQIERAKMSAILGSASAGFGALADILKQSQGEQSSIYKAMFAASKAFAIAEATVNAWSAISKAWNSAPFPANLAAVAATTPAVMGVISSITSASYSGRQYGGPVGSGGMYRINETGAPEVLNTASGRQYLLPNARGQVVSNKDATNGKEGSGSRVTVILNEDASRGGEVEQETGSDQETIIRVFVADIRNGGDADTAIRQTYGLDRKGR